MKLTMKLDAEHDQHENGEDEPIAGDPFKQTMVARVTGGDLFEYETNDTERLSVRCLVNGC